MKHSNNIKLLALLAPLTLLSTGVQAGFIVNGSFEDNTAGSYAALAGGDSTSITGWTTTDTGVELFIPPNAADGSYIVDLNNYIYNKGGIQQTFTTEIGRKYTITFAATTIQQSGRDGTGQVDVMIGADEYSYLLENHTASYLWEYYSFDYIATDITTTLKFSNSTNSFQNFSFIDDVNGDLATVPVPAAAWLFGSGIVGLIAVARRKV